MPGTVPTSVSLYTWSLPGTDRFDREVKEARPSSENLQERLIPEVYAEREASLGLLRGGWASLTVLRGLPS